MLNDLTLAQLVAELHTALARKGPFGPARFEEARTLLALPWMDELHPEARLRHLADTVRDAVERLDDARQTIVHVCFGMDDDTSTHGLGLGKRIEEGARRVPVNVDRARQEHLPGALAEVAFQIAFMPAMTSMGKLYPLGLRVRKVEITDVFDGQDPNVRTVVTRLTIRYMRDKVTVLPRQWLPAPAWRSIGRPRVTSAGHAYIGAVPNTLSSDPRNKIDFIFLGTDNEIGRDATVEIRRKGRLPLTASQRLRCAATDEPDEISLALENVPGAIAQYRQAVYADQTLLAPISSSAWTPPKRDRVDARWQEGSHMGETYALEWRLG